MFFFISRRPRSFSACRMPARGPFWVRSNLPVLIGQPKNEPIGQILEGMSGDPSERYRREREAIRGLRIRPGGPAGTLLIFACLSWASGCAHQHKAGDVITITYATPLGEDVKTLASYLDHEEAELQTSIKDQKYEWKSFKDPENKLHNLGVGSLVRVIEAQGGFLKVVVKEDIRERGLKYFDEMQNGGRKSDFTDMVGFIPLPKEYDR